MQHIKRNFALIGHPLSHTMSPPIHRALFCLSGMSADYSALEIAPERLKDMLPELRRLSGFNVTTPHKVAIIPHLDALDASASRYGAVNTVRVENGRMTGLNTDCDGFERALAGAGIALRGRVCVLGAGGAGRMFAMHSALAGCEVSVAARRSSIHKALALCDEISSCAPEAGACALAVEDVRGGWDVLVNATTCGMYPGIGASPVGEEALEGTAALFDAIYNPAETLLMQMARKRGIAVLGGMPMLVWQAAAAHTAWYGADFGEEQIAVLTREMPAVMEKLF